MTEDKAKTKIPVRDRLLRLGRKLSTKSKIIIVVAATFVICITVLLLVSQNKSGQLTTISKSSLEKIVEINELSTLDYVYNAIAIKYTDDSKDKIKYYIAYEGTVTAGIDFHKIDFSINRKKKTVTIIIPEVQIQDVRIDMGTVEYIFIKNKYNTETISQEAYRLCKTDLKKRAESETLLYDTARENAISSIEALFKPWIETIDKEYKVEIK